MATAKAPLADLLAARRDGLSYAAIGAKFGITKQSAWERIDRAEKAARAAIEVPATSATALKGSPGLDAALERWPDLTIAELQALSPALAPKPADAIILAVIQRDGIDAAQDRWPRLTIAELQRIKNAGEPPAVITEAAIAGVERYLASAAVDTTAVIDRPVSVEVKPRPGPAPNPALAAEIFNRICNELTKAERAST